MRRWGYLTVYRYAVNDISDRKRVEEELKKTSEEKSTLLRELRHRTKNNFNMIYSMVNLAVFPQSSPDTKSTITKLADRIRSVSDVYDLLYAEDSFNEIPLHQYCVKIAGSIAGLKNNVVFATDLDPISISAKEAALLGLILTELIPNAVKHAFPQGNKGTVSISLKRTENGGVLVVADDGVGAEYAKADRNDSGLTLVKALAAQIEGDFSILDAKPGTRAWARVSFPVPYASAT